VFPDIDETEANGLWKKELAKPPKEDAARDDSESDLLN
jgi:Lon-like ATP-dependent protease